MENVGLLQTKLDKLRDTRAKLENKMRLNEARNCQNSAFRSQTLEKELEVLRQKKESAKARNAKLLEEVFGAITFFTETTSSLGLHRTRENLRKAKVQFADIVRSNYPEWVRAINDPVSFQQENYAEMLQKLKDIQEAEAEEFNRQVEAQHEFRRTQAQYQQLIRQGEDLHLQRERMLAEMRIQNEEAQAAKPWPADRVPTADSVPTIERVNTAATRSKTPDIPRPPRPSLRMSSGDQVNIQRPTQQFLSFGNPVPVATSKLDRPPSAPPRHAQPGAEGKPPSRDKMSSGDQANLPRPTQQFLSFGNPEPVVTSKLDRPPNSPPRHATPPVEVKSPSRDSGNGISLIPEISGPVQKLKKPQTPFEPPQAVLAEFDPEADQPTTTKYIDLDEESIEDSGPLRPPPRHGPIQQPLHSFGSPQAVAQPVYELTRPAVQGGSSIVRTGPSPVPPLPGREFSELSDFDQPSKTDSSRLGVRSPPKGTFQIPEVDVEGSLEDSSQLSPYLVSVTQSRPRRPPVSLNTSELPEDTSNASSKFTPKRKRTSSIDLSPRSMTSSIITTDTPQLLCIHEFLNNLSQKERLTVAQLLKKQAQEICLRSGKRLSDLMKVRVTEAELEQLVRNFRSSARLPKQGSAEEAVVKMFMLCSSLREPFLPFELGRSRVDFTEFALQDRMSPENFELFVLLKDFVLEAVGKGWFKQDVGVKLLVYNLVNYKVSKRQFKRAEDSIQKIVKLGLGDDPLRGRPSKPKKSAFSIDDFQEIIDLES